MSAFSELREAEQEREAMRPHLSQQQNEELADSAASAKRWLVVGYGTFGLMILALIALAS